MYVCKYVLFQSCLWKKAPILLMVPIKYVHFIILRASGWCSCYLNSIKSFPRLYFVWEVSTRNWVETARLTGAKWARHIHLYLYASQWMWSERICRGGLAGNPLHPLTGAGRLRSLALSTKRAPTYTHTHTRSRNRFGSCPDCKNPNNHRRLRKQFHRVY